MSSIRLATLATVIVVVLLPSAALGGPPVRAEGPLADLQPSVANPTDGAAARAQVTEHADATTVTLSLSGLTGGAAPVTLGAHVHVGPCLAGDGAAAGPHYNSGGPVSEDTEVWLDFTIHGDGVGHAVANVPFVIPDGGAQSIVVHALPTNETGGAGSRIACIGVAL